VYVQDPPPVPPVAEIAGLEEKIDVDPVVPTD
jgi:hypothetical protein